MTENENTQEPVKRILINFGDNDFWSSLMMFGESLIAMTAWEYGLNKPNKRLTKQQVMTLFNMMMPAMYLASQCSRDRVYGKLQANGFYHEDRSTLIDKETGNLNERAFNYLSIKIKNIYVNDQEIGEAYKYYEGHFNSEAVIIDFIQGTTFQP